jgi:hypothetical protein
MKKIKTIIASILAAAMLSFGFGMSTVAAFADEGAENAVISVESISVEEVVEETESVENSAVIETKGSATESVEKETEVTFDDILNLAGKLAEKEGFKDEWDKTLYYLKTAASEKKVDAMIILLGAVFAFLLLYGVIKLRSWYKKIKTDTTSKDLTDIKNESGQQTKAINSLIDEDEKLVGEVAAASAREKVMTEALEQQNIALRALIRGTQIKQDLKDEAFRALNKSDELCDIAKK